MNFRDLETSDLTLGLILRPISSDYCVKRSYEMQTSRPPPQTNADVGVVVVLCNEDLRWLQNLAGGCHRKHIYIYSKCGASEAQLRSKLGRVSPCVTIQVCDYHLERAFLGAEGTAFGSRNHDGCFAFRTSSLM